MKLDAIVDELYKDSPTKPLVIAPDSIYFINQTELPDFLQAAGAGRVDVVTNHYYNLGGGLSIATIYSCYEYDMIGLFSV